jgi:hypothetical protein
MIQSISQLMLRHVGSLFLTTAFTSLAGCWAAELHPVTSITLRPDGSWQPTPDAQQNAALASAIPRDPIRFAVERPDKDFNHFIISYQERNGITSPLIEGPFPHSAVSMLSDEDGRIPILTDSDHPYAGTSEPSAVIPINLSEFKTSSIWREFDISKGASKPIDRPTALDRSVLINTAFFSNALHTLAVIPTKNGLHILNVPTSEILASLRLPEQTMLRVGFSSGTGVGIASCEGDPPQSSFHVLDCTAENGASLVHSFDAVKGCVEWIFGSREGLAFGLLISSPESIYSVATERGEIQVHQSSASGSPSFDAARMHDHFFMLSKSMVSRYMVTRNGVELSDSITFSSVDFDQEAGGEVSADGRTVLATNPIGKSRLIDQAGLLIPEVPTGRLAVSRDGGVCIIARHPSAGRIEILAPANRD